MVSYMLPNIDTQIIQMLLGKLYFQRRTRILGNERNVVEAILKVKGLLRCSWLEETTSYKMKSSLKNITEYIVLHILKSRVWQQY